ncbi:sterol desaturase family protein [Allokutzneria oryzae]|uniref:Sterol desaturase family protein n=1 Tax=Allokutzneria oryzae TaxID=1378989 RepID=A0ABV5ZZD1_9PSEU
MDIGWLVELLNELNEPILWALPVFVVFTVVEIVSLHVLRHDEDAAGYGVRDSVTSLTMGVGYLVVNVVWRVVALAVYAVIYQYSPLRLDPGDWWVWLVLVIGDDLCFYAYHRSSHRIRLMWASHVAHHSSVRLNFTTALRQKWVPMFMLPFWIPLAALGIPPWMIFVAMSWNLTYQFFLHTERVGRLPRWVEFVFNTPSHHRVHHGSDAEYLDRNYGGIFIVWDRLFGSFADETRRPTYGLTTNIDTYNPFRVAFHEFAALGRDLRGSRGWRERLGYTFGPPGWRPGSPAQYQNPETDPAG